MDVCRVLCVVR